MISDGGIIIVSGYAVSKLALVKLMEYFGAENPSLRVVTVHPGIVPSTRGGQRMTKQSGFDWPGDDSTFPSFPPLSSHFLLLFPRFFFFFFFLLFIVSRDVPLLTASPTVNLPAHFLVWATSEEAKFLKNKFVFANWDVEELKARADEIAGSPELTISLNGFPRNVE